MPIDNSNKEDIAAGTDGWYEARADQEEIYREETEEAVREVLDSYELRRSHNNGSCMGDNVGEPLDHAARELITGDADDPPLSEQTIGNILQNGPQGRTA